MSDSETHDVVSAHKHCAHNKKEIEESIICGCFYCLSVYPPADVECWCDEGQTALCPRCGIDSVVGDKSGFSVQDQGFLEAMKERWF